MEEEFAKWLKNRIKALIFSLLLSLGAYCIVELVRLWRERRRARGS